jgi:seryl-tRNA synthetase
LFTVFHYQVDSMLDIKFIREFPNEVQQNCANKLDSTNIAELLDIDGKRRSIIQTVEEQKALRNSASQEVANRKRSGQNADDVIEHMRVVGESIKELDSQLAELEETIEAIMLRIPNMAHRSVPLGKDASDNQEIRRHGECLSREYRVEHLEIARTKQLLDFERGAKVAGTGFGFYTGKGARLERALINFFLDTNTAKGYQEIMPPVMANPESLRGTGQLPKSEEDMYFMERDNLYMIPTAEVPITNFYRNETLQGSQLPLHYAGYSACFRREAGSYGKDTRGFLRVHQFNKVELVKFVEPESSYPELESMVQDVEAIVSQLGLTYRVLLLCTGDMTFGGAKTYDIEVWAPFEQRWLEVSSCTNFESFQSRRANIRYKETPNSKPEFLHTLNGSGLATSRILVAILEQYQQPDGSLRIPSCLIPYCGFEEL